MRLWPDSRARTARRAAMPQCRPAARSDARISACERGFRMPEGVRKNYCPSGLRLFRNCFLTRPGIQRLAKAMRLAVAPT